MLTNEQIGDMYYQMVRIQLWEQMLLRLIDENKVSGFYHAGRGHEAVQVGACAALLRDDYLVYDHRGCGHLIAKGVPMDKLFGDFLANVHGTTRGLGAGIVHIAWPDVGVLGQSGTLGGNFPIAAGAALRAKYLGTTQVSLCMFGDSASNRGTFQESANVASIWKLPLVWLCANNLYGVSVPMHESSAVENIADRACAYNMPGVIVDGMDVVAVYDAVATAVNRARQGEGPTLIEAKTYRFRGHYEGDPERYRSKEEIEEWKKRDPITTLANRLVSEGIRGEQDLETIRSKAQQEVDQAVEVALQAPLPPPERIYEYVYA